MKIDQIHEFRPVQKKESSVIAAQIQFHDFWIRLFVDEAEDDSIRLQSFAGVAALFSVVSFFTAFCWKFMVVTLYQSWVLSLQVQLVVSIQKVRHVAPAPQHQLGRCRDFHRFVSSRHSLSHLLLNLGYSLPST